MPIIFQVVTAPMSTINAIAVEAYKKYILVSLIHNGQVCFLLFSVPFLGELGILHTFILVIYSFYS